MSQFAFPSLHTHKIAKLRFRGGILVLNDQIWVEIDKKDYKYIALHAVKFF